MRIFISWSGARSQAIAKALRNWLPTVINGIEFFHSEEIPKGRSWHPALVEALRGCPVGIFCVTPESLRSPWMLFEAGALAQHGDQPTLFTYLYGVGELTGPLSYFQATRFDHDDTRRLVLALSQLVGAVDDQAIRRRFGKTWQSFEATVVASVLLPVQELLPEFPALFDRMTFDVPFAECSDMQWGGLVPDEDIRAAYSSCRNYAFLPDKARLIRERAGVIDGQGNVMPGYVLLDNGCIVGA